MSRKHVMLFAALVLVLLSIVYFMKRNSYNRLLEQQRYLVTFEQGAKEIGTLKKKFSDKQAIRRQIAMLERIAKPSKVFDKGKKKVLEFDDLNAQTLDTLMRKIANSTLRITRLSLTRIDDLRAKLRVEIAR